MAEVILFLLVFSYHIMQLNLEFTPDSNMSWKK